MSEDLLDEERTVNFRTDLEPETKDESELTEQEVAKILRNRIAEVSGAETRGSNLVGDIWGSMTGSRRAPGLGQYGETSTNAHGTEIRVNPQRTLAEKLAKMLPEDMRKRSILENGDVRALLQQIMIAPGQAEKGDTFTINGVQFSANERAAAGLIMVEMTNKVRDSFAANVRSATKDPALAEEVIANFEREVLYDYRDGVMHSSLPIDEAHFGNGAYGRDPDGNPIALGGSGTSATNVALGAGSYDTTGEGAGDEFPFYTEEEVTNLFATTYDQNQTVQQIYATEAQQREGAEGTGGRTTGREVSVQYDAGDTTSYYNTPDHLGGTAARESEKVTKATKLTLTQMANKPKEMTREQIISLSKKMEAAGIYELIGAKPTIPGDWTDPTFKKAYERLMGLAVEQKKPMTALLQDRTSVYQKSLEDSLSTRLTDPARIRRSVDEVGRTTLGRALSPEEHAELTTFVHDLERRNAKVESATDPELANIGGLEDLDEGIIADIDARLADKIQMENLDESSAKSVQKQYDTFSSFLAGPGRGI